MRRDWVEFALRSSDTVTTSIANDKPCNLPILADETAFHYLLSAYEEAVYGVTYRHLLTRPKVAEPHSVEPCIMIFTTKVVV